MLAQFVLLPALTCLACWALAIEQQLALGMTLNGVIAGLVAITAGCATVTIWGAVIIGGHTVRDVEIKYGLSATGVVTDAELLTNQQAKPGDALVLTKALGTGFITTAFMLISTPLQGMIRPTENSPTASRLTTCLMLILLLILRCLGSMQQPI